jgi:hypothetical protein
LNAVARLTITDQPRRRLHFDTVDRGVERRDQIEVRTVAERDEDVPTRAPQPLDRRALADVALLARVPAT